MNTPFTQQPLEAYAELTEKIRSGEYYREARNMYDINVHDPMAERYFFILITALATAILLVSVIAARSLYPLTVSVPFIYSPNDIVEDQPRMQSLLNNKGEDPSIAVLRFLGQNYVVSHEEYDIDNISRAMNSVRSQSSAEVLKEYEQSVDPRNPESMVALYQRHSVRRIEVLGTSIIEGEENQMEVFYEATVESKTDIKKTRWKANISFRYSGIELDENGKPKPLSFLVTQYRTKRIQETK